MPARSPASRYVVQTLTPPDKIAYVDMDRGNATVIGAPAFVFLAIGSAAGLGFMTFALAGFGALLGGIVVKATPDQMNATQWIKTAWYYKKQPKEVDSMADAAVQANDGLAGYYTADQETQEYTNIQRFYPDLHIIKRTDGALVGGFRVVPGNTSFATSEDMAKVRRAIATWGNNHARFPFQFYATSASYPVESYGESLKSRLDDPDLADKPVQKAVLESEVANRPRGINESGQGQRQYYIITRVERADIVGSETGEETPLERLTDAGFLGMIFQAFAQSREADTKADRDRQMLRTLQDRMEIIDDRLIAQVEGWNSEPLEIDEWVKLQHRLWTGYEPELQNVTDHTSTQQHIGAKETTGDDLNPEAES